MDSKEHQASYWLALVERLCRESEIVDLLARHGVSLEKQQWIHGAGRVALPKVGVYLYLWKAGVGKSADILIHGVDFVLSGMRKGDPYPGSLPYDILRTDSLEAIRGKLAPAVVTKEYGPTTYGACFPDHRIFVEFKKNGQLRSCGWVSVKERRRIPAA